jgi:hypothetical protein
MAPPRVLRALASSPDSVRHRGAPADYRAAALSAERWIAASAVRDRDGVRWPADPAVPTAITPDLYSGSAGVVLFYLELHHATGNERHLKEAVAGARALTAAAPSSAGGVSGDGAGLYTGVAGLAAEAVSAPVRCGHCLERLHRHHLGDRGDCPDVGVVGRADAARREHRCPAAWRITVPAGGRPPGR